MSKPTGVRGILGLVAASLVIPAIAQDEISLLDEIVVTSTKRQSTLQEIHDPQFRNINLRVKRQFEGLVFGEGAV